MGRPQQVCRELITADNRRPVQSFPLIIVIGSEVQKVVLFEIFSISSKPRGVSNFISKLLVVGGTVCQPLHFLQPRTPTPFQG